MTKAAQQLPANAEAEQAERPVTVEVCVRPEDVHTMRGLAEALTAGDRGDPVRERVMRSQLKGKVRPPGYKPPASEEERWARLEEEVPCELEIPRPYSFDYNDEDES